MKSLDERCRELAPKYIGVVVRIAHNKSSKQSNRMKALEMLMRYGFKDLIDHSKLGGLVKEYYVYSVHDVAGRLIYVGKGKRHRHFASAKRLNGRSRVRAEFYTEAGALAFERRLIKRFKPQFNLVYAATEQGKYR